MRLVSLPIPPPAAYFQIARWIFLLNLGVALVFLCFLLLPAWIGGAAGDNSHDARDVIGGLLLPEDLRQSWLFYGEAFARAYGGYEMDSAWVSRRADIFL